MEAVTRRLTFDEPAEMLTGRYAPELPKAKMTLKFNSGDNEDDQNSAEDAADYGIRGAGELTRYRDDRRSHSETFRSSNPQSRQRQRKELQRRSSEALRNGENPAETVFGQLRQRFIKKPDSEPRKSGSVKLLIPGLICLLLLGLISSVSSCTVMLQAVTATIALGTYPSMDTEMLAAEARYLDMENELRDYLLEYEENLEYDSYEYETDEIGHDPYVLISAITALKGGAWKADELGDILQMLFSQQYILTETEITEQKLVWDVQLKKNVRVTETGCRVKLENMDLARVPSFIMNEEQLAAYAGYMASLGNASYLFPDSDYIGRYITGEYEVYEVPPEALKDKEFAAMVKEAEKYLGYPYVWGGSSPATSFDCSGFICWVLEKCGWDVGRTTAQGLFEYCTPVSRSNAQPGDLIFFTGTYKTADACSHIGLYVGNGMMLHCGDPISYASINQDYWQSHFYAFGRLPK